ncbi:hypothetical protein [Streptomyces sp. NBC_00887]|nr:hypothetical protein OG844_12850 [Streptomyces sp. NBC_00887]
MDSSTTPEKAATKAAQREEKRQARTAAADARHADKGALKE